MFYLAGPRLIFRPNGLFSDNLNHTRTCFSCCLEFQTVDNNFPGLGAAFGTESDSISLRQRWAVLKITSLMFRVTSVPSVSMLSELWVLCAVSWRELWNLKRQAVSGKRKKSIRYEQFQFYNTINFFWSTEFWLTTWVTLSPRRKRSPRQPDSWHKLHHHGLRITAASKASQLIWTIWLNL